MTVDPLTSLSEKLYSVSTDNILTIIAAVVIFGIVLLLCRAYTCIKKYTKACNKFFFFSLIITKSHGVHVTKPSCDTNEIEQYANNLLGGKGGVKLLLTCVMNQFHQFNEYTKVTSRICNDSAADQ